MACQTGSGNDLPSGHNGGRPRTTSRPELPSRRHLAPLVIPYLPNFHVLRSEIDVQTTTSLDLDREDVDVAIHWGSGEPGHGVARAGFLAGLDLVRQAARDPGPVGERAPAQAPGARATRAPVPRRRSGAW